MKRRDVETQRGVPPGRHRNARGKQPLYAFAILASGLLAAGRPAAFAAAAASALLAAWLVPFLFRHPAKEASVMLDPDHPETAMLADGVRFAIQSAQDAPTALRIQLPAVGQYLRYSIDLGRRGDVQLICAGKRPVSLGFEGQWIADHPLPLVFTNGCPATLLFAPAGEGRVRVSFAQLQMPSPWFWLVFATAALLFFVLDWTTPLAAALAFAGGVWIAHCTKETP